MQKEEKQKEEDDKFEEQHRQDAEDVEQQAAGRRDEVAATIAGDIGKGSDELARRLKAEGGYSDDAAQHMFEEMQAGLESIASTLEDDKARQQELLKKRLAARRKKRQKLQGDLKEVDDRIEEKENEYAAKKEEINERHHQTYVEACNEAEKEYTEAESALDQRLKETKTDKLAAHEEKLREAKQTTDFSKVLEEYQGAQDKIEKDLDKQR
jgi:hypothetical protein